MNFFRCTADIYPAYGSILTNGIAVAAHQAQGQGTPGCWTYGDMLEVGVTSSPARSGGLPGAPAGMGIIANAGCGHRTGAIAAEFGFARF